MTNNTTSEPWESYEDPRIYANMQHAYAAGICHKIRLIIFRKPQIDFLASNWKVFS